MTLLRENFPNHLRYIAMKCAILSTLFLSSICHVAIGKMIVFYGTFNNPDNFNITLESKTNSWVNCICKCRNNTNCLLVYRSSNNLSCYMVNFDNRNATSNMKYTNNPDDLEIAIKSDITNCSQSQELLENQQFDELKACPFSYTKLMRENYVVCGARLYYNLTNSEAINKCVNGNGRILGLENEKERLHWSVLNPESKMKTTKVVLGASISNEGVVWTDPWITGTSQMVLATGYPKDGDDCVVLQMNTTLLESDKSGNSNCGSSCQAIVLCGFLI